MMRIFRNRPPQGGSSLLPAAALAGTAVAIALAIPAAAILHQDYSFFTRDPTQIGRVPFYAGYLSSLGVLAWTTGAAVALFAASAAESPASRRFLVYFGCFTALLALDDLFLLHENAPWNEKATFLAYLLAALAGWLLFRAEFRTPAGRFATAAACALLLSLVIDRLQHPLQARIGGARILLEDGAKFFGAVCWAVFLCKTAAARLPGSPRP